MTLFSRTGRGVVPTEFGQLLVGHAQLVLRDREHAIEALTSLRDGVVGHARVGVAPALAGVLPEAIEKISRERPGLAFFVVHGTYDSLVHGLRDGEIDGAFTLLPPGESQEGLSVHSLVDDEVRVLCGADHPLARKRKVELRALFGERWALMNRPRSILTAFRAFAEAELEGGASARITVESDSLDLIKSLVVEHGFLTVLPPGAVEFELRAKRIRALPIEGLPTLSAGFVHRQEVLPPAVALLLDEVSALLKGRRG